MQREKLGSRLGFILLSAGCAIGVGNVWKFPYLVGENGGAIFVLIYIVFLLIMGIPVMTMEFALGRASQKSPARLYQELERDGQKWHIHGWACVAGNILLMMFYTTVSAWMLQYFFKTMLGDFKGLDAGGVANEFAKTTQNPSMITLFVGIILTLALLICVIGVKKGLERVSKVMMIALLAIMIFLVIFGLFQDGAVQGLKFYLVPDFDKMAEIGIGNIIVAAMNQSFFTLSIGIGSMAIFGSYIGKEKALLGESVTIAALDFFVAFASGLIIFPACFANGVEVSAGPSLIFVTLPNIFNNMPAGRLWGSLFFLFMTFAAFSTIIAVFENIVACIEDLTGLSRKKLCAICAAGLFVLSVPCVLGFSVWSGFEPLWDGSNIMDLEDFIVSNVILPLGSMMFVIFSTQRLGWGWDNFTLEANTGDGLKVKPWMRKYMTYVLPLMIFALFVVGIVQTIIKIAA